MSELSVTSGTIACRSCGQTFAATGLFCPACGTAKARDFDGDPLLGSLVGDRFLIQDRIGHGASGTIYRAEHVTLRRRVALKVLHHELSRDDLSIERFRREATTVSEIDNEHIVEIYDFGRTADGRLYLAMELLDGETLAAILERDKRLPVDRVVDILIQLGEALMEAHAMGYLHRDLRPRNIYLAQRRSRPNFVKLLDFGLSKLVESEGEAASTSLGMTFGDPKYMSPEQARGDAVDRRADIYSLGCIAYQMLVGEPPFTGKKVFDILTKHVDAQPVEPLERRRDVPPWLNAAVMRMLAKRPEERFITVYRLVEALRDGQKTGQVMADERARRRETDPPASVSRAMAAARERAAERGDEPPAFTAEAPSAPLHVPPDDPAPAYAAARRDAAADDLRATTMRQPAPAPGERGRVASASADAAPAPARPVPEPADEPGPARRTRPTGKRRAGSAAESSSGISAAWFADGEAITDGERGGASSATRARATHSPSNTGILADDFEPPRGRMPLIAGIVGGAFLVVVLAALLWPRGGKADRASEAAAPATLPAPPAPAQAAVPTADAGPTTAAPLAPEPTAAVAPATPGPAAAKSTPTPTTSKSTSAASTSRTTAGASRTTAAASEGDALRAARDLVSSKTDGGGSSGGSTGGSSSSDRSAGAGDDTKVDGATATKKKEAEFYAKMGGDALRDGDILGAARHFKKARELDSNNADAIVGMGEIALGQGAYADAAAHLERAAKLRPGSSRIHTLLGEAHLNAGNTDKAAAAFKKALQLDANNARARNGYNEATGTSP